jgi:hypothetical protein
MTEQTDNNDFTFFCPECSSQKRMSKADIGKTIECEACCETVKVVYPETRPCPKCKKSIKLQAKVCKYCKERVMPFVDPFEHKAAPLTTEAPAPEQPKISRRIKAFAAALLGLAGGFAVGLFGARAVAKITHHHISHNADYLVGAILGIYLAIRLYRSPKN